MNRPRGTRNGGWRIFRWPLALATTSLIGLVAALIGDGWHDVVSWMLLGGLIAVMIWAYRRPA